MHKPLPHFYAVVIFALVSFLLVAVLVSFSGSDKGSWMALGSKPGAKLRVSSMGEAPRQPVSPIEALLAAARRGDVETAKLLLEAGVRADVRDANGLTPLMLAAREGHAEIVALLVDAKADINGANRRGMTPLMIAAGAGHLKVVRALIASGADLLAHDGTGLTALMWAEKNGHVQIETLLAPKGLAPENARVARLQRFLIELGYDPGPVDGLYGPQTAAAVREYQREARLPITGLVTDELVQHARYSLTERRLAHSQTGQGS